jgi:HCOMODA/2-hydroxy-3-carboxy-muconic semialdehyde decarboxylase
VSAASVTAADIIENDLNSEAISGHRDDEFQEVYLHGGIYKARPDVMAVIHAHTPELVVFSANSVGMGLVYNGASFIGPNLKNWVIGKYDKYENVVSTPALGEAMSKDMGNDTVMLLAGHGIALGAPSIYDLVAYADSLRRNAQIQQQAILTHGRVNFLPAPQPQAFSGQASSPDGSGGGRRAAERAWEYWRQTLKIRD